MALVPAGRIRDAEPTRAWVRLQARRRAARRSCSGRCTRSSTRSSSSTSSTTPTPPCAGAGQLGDPPAGALARAAAAAEPRAPAARPAPRTPTRSPTCSPPPPAGTSSASATPASPAGASTPPTRSSRSATPPRRARARRASTSRSPSALGLPGPRGAGLRALARAAHRPSVIALLERAAALLAHSSPNRLEHTRALVDLGAALRRANRRADARAPLRRALDLADRGGMRLLARRARHELRAAGARPRRTALSGHRRAHPRRAPRRHPRRRRPQQPRDRPAALRHPAHRRNPPHARLPEARHHRSRRTPRTPHPTGTQRRAACRLRGRPRLMPVPRRLGDVVQGGTDRPLTHDARGLPSGEDRGRRRRHRRVPRHPPGEGHARAGRAASYGKRRVLGLRREEVASLAGVSADYYRRLERGQVAGVCSARASASSTSFDRALAAPDHIAALG